MESQNDTNSKTKEEKFKIEEIIAVSSEKTVKGINYIENRDRLSKALKNSAEYKYNEKKSLAENIYAAFPQYKLKELTKEYSTLMEAWKNRDLTFVDTAKNVKITAAYYQIPQELTIKVKDSRTKLKSKQQISSKPQETRNHTAKNSRKGIFLNLFDRGTNSNSLGN